MPYPNVYATGLIACQLISIFAYHMKNFLIKLFLFSGIIATLDLCWHFFSPAENRIPFVWPMLLFFMAASALFHALSIQASKGRPQAFIRFYMGSTGIRLFAYLLVILAYRFYDKPTLVPFAIGFMAHYFLFTAFEVPVLLKELRKGENQ